MIHQIQPALNLKYRLIDSTKSIFNDDHGFNSELHSQIVEIHHGIYNIVGIVKMIQATDLKSRP